MIFGFKITNSHSLTSNIKTAATKKVSPVFFWERMHDGD